jgi:hypothetical protein
VKKATWLTLIAAAVLYTAPLTLLLVKQADFSHRNCHSIHGLSLIERRFITRQEDQNQALLKSGITFGIPKDQLPGLIQKSQKSQASFLRELDALAANSCR